MQKNILFLLFILPFISARAQNDKRSADFIRAVLVVDSGKKTIYEDSIAPSAVSFIRQRLDSFYVYHSVQNPSDRPPIIFTSKEKNYINAELANMLKFAWKDSLLNNSLLIKSDTLRSIFMMPKVVNGKANFKEWPYFRSHFGVGFYDFSRPIFLRHHTICIFYNHFNCGYTCGGGDLSIYVRNKGKWDPLYSLASWDE